MKPYPFFLILWFLLASAAGALGFAARLQPPAPQILLFALVAILLRLYFRHDGFHSWLQTLSLKNLATLHLTRFVGFYFLWLYSQGRLPYAFAVPGGSGDIFVAAFALLLLMLPTAPRWAWITWNCLGLCDILFVVLTAARLGLTQPGSMAELLHLPLSLLATFLVPLIIFTHLVIFHRLREHGRLDDPSLP